jgi:hypothetical protein
VLHSLSYECLVVILEATASVSVHLWQLLLTDVQKPASQLNGVVKIDAVSKEHIMSDDVVLSKTPN